MFFIVRLETNLLSGSLFELKGRTGIQARRDQLSVDLGRLIFQMNDPSQAVRGQGYERLPAVRFEVTPGCRNRVAVRIVGGMAQPR